MVLRRAESERSATGSIPRRNSRRFPAPNSKTARSMQAAADSRAARRSSIAGVRHPQPANVFHRRASAAQSDPDRRPHLVLADHSQNWRSYLRGQSRVSPGCEGLDLPVPAFSLPTCDWNRAFIFLFGFPITHDPETNKKNRAKFQKLVKIAAEHGWGEYRTAPAHQAAVMDTYSFNNHALLRFHETLKDAVDPNGILSAGRYGIWPKHLRETKS